MGKFVCACVCLKKSILGDCNLNDSIKEEFDELSPNIGPTTYVFALQIDMELGTFSNRV